MASRSILSGIKTSAVINIGTATLAALIGAGGLGEPIISGLNLNDHVTILEGAIPAAMLALLVQWSLRSARSRPHSKRTASVGGSDCPKTTPAADGAEFDHMAGPRP